MGHQYDRKEFFIGDGFRDSKCDLSANCLTFELTMVHLLSSNILCVTLREPVIRLLLAFYRSIKSVAIHVKACQHMQYNYVARYLLTSKSKL